MNSAKTYTEIACSLNNKHFKISFVLQVSNIALGSLKAFSSEDEENNEEWNQTYMYHYSPVNHVDYYI
jgi:hypothetical protein